MPWFEQEALDFLRDIEVYNDRDWFKKNKQRYEEHVKEPLEHYVQALIHGMAAEGLDIDITPKDAIFRIYRDVRFSKDKSPYKTHVGAVIGPGGRRSKMLGGMYTEVSGRRLAFASGLYSPDKDELLQVRRYILAHPHEAEAVLNHKQFKKTYKVIEGEKNKILPPEFKEAAKEIPLLFNKQFYCWAQYDPEEALREDLVDFAIENWKASHTFTEFLKNATKP